MPSEGRKRSYSCWYSFFDLVDIRESLQAKFVKKIEPDFITIQQEPLDIVHLKNERYLIGSYDGSLMLKDVKDPKNDLTFRQHLNNRATWIRSIIRDNESKVWVATSNELTVYNKSFKIVMQTRSYNPTVKFYGHFKILWTDKKGQYIFWWCDRDAIKVFHSRTLKLMSKVKGLIKNTEERPNHYTFLDGSYKKMFIITNNEPLPNKYYVVDVLRRSVQRGEYDFPQDDKSLKFSYLCMAYNCPSTCIVTTGVCARFSTDKKVIHRSKENEMPHLTVYKLTAENKLDYVDHYFNSDLKHMNNSAIVFHRPNHSRMLAVQTNDILVLDLIDGKLQMLFVIKDINRGEVVHQLIRLSNSFLFVGNFGQIFKVEFNSGFFQPNRLETQRKPKSGLIEEKTEKSPSGSFQLLGGYTRKPASMNAFPDAFSINPASPGPIGFFKEPERAPAQQKLWTEKKPLALGSGGFSLDQLERSGQADNLIANQGQKGHVGELTTNSVGRQYQAWGSYGIPKGEPTRKGDSLMIPEEDWRPGLKKHKHDNLHRYPADRNKY